MCVGVCEGERNKDKNVLDREKPVGAAPSGRQPEQRDQRAAAR